MTATRTTVVLMPSRRALLIAFIALPLTACGSGDRLLTFQQLPASMEPTIAPGQRITVNRSAYLTSAPKIGDVIALHPPQGAVDIANMCGTPVTTGDLCPVPTPGASAIVYIKRIVAGPGNRVGITDGHTVLNGKLQREPFTAPCGGGDGCSFADTITVPTGDYFVLGDNRGQSDDSRFWGPIPRTSIIGKVVGK
jgi:signal peptidase I